MELFVELLQVALGNRNVLSRIPSEDEWQQIYETAAKQSLVGLVLRGIEELRAKNIELSVPRVLLLQWIGEVQIIEQQNKKLNEAVEHLTRIFKNGGYSSCVLKGQGVARLYDVRCKKSDVRSTSCRAVEQRANDNSEQNSDGLSSLNSLTGTPETFGTLGTNTDNTIGGSLSLRRQPGDIDVWVEGGRENVLKFLKERHLNIGKIVIHHVDASIIEGVETEVHFLPSYTYDYLRYIKYIRFFKEEASWQFDHFDEQVGFAYPTNRFNVVYLMMHIFRHVFHEGIGLRQFLDYYFVLIHLTDEERKWAYGKLKWLGLGKVTSAVMYVMKAVFLMEDKYLLCSPSEKTGKYLLEEIIAGGNFGKFGEQYESAHSGSSFNLYLKNLKRLGKVYSLCPSEVLWAPIWKPTHWMWRKWKGYV